MEINCNEINPEECQKCEYHSIDKDDNTLICRYVGVFCCDVEKKECVNHLTFYERYKKGEIPYSVIDDYVERWHTGNDSRSLQEFLGLSDEQYEYWLQEGKLKSDEKTN